MIDMFQRRTGTGEKEIFSMSPTAGMVILIALMALLRLTM